MQTGNAGVPAGEPMRRSNVKLALVLAAIALAIYAGFVLSGLSRG